MAKRRKGTKVADLLILLWIGVLAWLGYPPREHLMTWIAVVPVVLLLWVAFVMPTGCGYKQCGRGVRGKLRGCREHAFGARSAGRHFRVG
ncbi:MAG TPA: hypothetical protein VG497_33560 [Kribbella sp.]|nr:hypothetical protein [Kribbella sp.]